MSDAAFPDLLGPLEVAAPNQPEAIPLRKLVRVRGGVTLTDDPGAMCSRIRFPDYTYSVVTVTQATIAASSMPWIEGLSAADLVRVEATGADVTLEGMADSVHLGAYYYAVRAVPNKPMKVLVNVGTHSLRVQPPAAAPSDPNRAGIFLDSIELTPQTAVRIVWDGQDFGYRIHSGRRVYLTYQGKYVVHQGQRIYYYPQADRRVYLTYQGKRVVHTGRPVFYRG